MNEKKYEFTGETLSYNGKTLYRIRRLSDGLVGGFIESECNLSHEGSCFVYDNALVSGNAWVFGDAQVSGNATATSKVIISNAHKHHITITDDYIAIGCENHSLDHWKKNINDIANRHRYTAKELKELKQLLNILLKQKRRYGK